jgi:hypothetical protein
MLLRLHLCRILHVLLPVPQQPPPPQHRRGAELRPDITRTQRGPWFSGAFARWELCSSSGSEVPVLPPVPRMFMLHHRSQTSTTLHLQHLQSIQSQSPSRYINQTALTSIPKEPGCSSDSTYTAVSVMQQGSACYAFVPGLRPGSVRTLL